MEREHERLEQLEEDLRDLRDSLRDLATEIREFRKEISTVRKEQQDLKDIVSQWKIGAGVLFALGFLGGWTLDHFNQLKLLIFSK